MLLQQIHFDTQRDGGNKRDQGATRKAESGLPDKQLLGVRSTSGAGTLVLLKVDSVRLAEVLRRKRSRVVRHLSGCHRRASQRTWVGHDMLAQLTLLDNLTDKHLGETANDGEDRRRDGLLQDRVDELGKQAQG